MPQAQTVSINKMRSDAVLVLRGFFTLALLPAYCLLMLIVWIVRDLPQVDLTPLRLLLVGGLVALTIAGVFLGRHAPARLTAPYLWCLIIGSFSLIAIGGTALAVWTGKRAHEPAGVSLGIAAVLLIPIVILFYWLLLSPTMAALRLLATRVPPDGTPLPTVLASPLPQRDAGDAVAPTKKMSPAAVAYRVAAAALGIVATVLVLWLFALSLFAIGHIEYIVMALVLEFAAIYVVKVLWRRGRKHAAIDAHAALLSDPRSPILYLRSFQDDPHMLPTEWDLLMRTGFGRAGRRLKQGPIAQLVARMSTTTLWTSGGRLEENLTAIVAPIGPFVAIGEPDEPLPQLGAARAYFTEDTWQSQVIKLVDRAQLIVMVASSTHSIRWELATILNRNAWPKLLVLMQLSTQEDNAARWDTIVAELQDGPWRESLATLDPHEVVAMRLLEGGGLSVVTSDRRHYVDYGLAMRIMLHQMQKAAPT
jgi:hypothetical protein